jgi:hypothetical protein
VIGQARRQHDEDGAFCHADRPRLCDGKPTRTAGAQAPRSGSGAAALPKPTTGPGASDWQASDTMPMKPFTARMAPFVECGYVFTGSGVVVFKTKVGQH